MKQPKDKTRWSGNTGIFTFPELAAMTKIIRLVIEIFCGNPTEGSLLLNFKKHRSKDRHLLCTNLDKGAYRPKVGASSEFLVSEVVNGVDLFPKKDSLFADLPAARTFEELHSGIWCTDVGNKKALVAQADNGRYSCGFYANFPKDGRIMTDRVLYAVALTLSYIRSEDITLRESAQMIYGAGLHEDRKLIEVRDFITDHFSRCELPELIEWRTSLSDNTQELTTDKPKAG